jgi:hypothetical protein
MPELNINVSEGAAALGITAADISNALAANFAKEAARRKAQKDKLDALHATPEWQAMKAKEKAARNEMIAARKARHRSHYHDWTAATPEPREITAEEELRLRTELAEAEARAEASKERLAQRLSLAPPAPIKVRIIRDQ